MTSAYALLGGAAGFALGGPAGAAIGAGIGGGIDRNISAQDMAASAQDFSAQQYASRYQTQVKDMQAAGLNPMLAYMQAPGASPQGVSYNPVNPYERVASDYSSAYNVQRQGENIEADTELKISQIDLNDSQKEQVEASVKKIEAEVRNLESDNVRIKALTDLLLEQKQLYYKQGLTQQAQGDMLRATTDKLRQEIPWLSSQEFLNNARKELINVETELKRLDLNAAQQFDNFGREAKELKPVVEIIKMLIGTFSPRSGITINR